MELEGLWEMELEGLWEMGLEGLWEMELEGLWEMELDWMLMDYQLQYTLMELDLLLKLAGELGHAILVLLVLGLGEVKLLGFALGSLESLGGLSSAGLSGSQLGLQLADLALHLGHGGLASLQSGIFRISQATLQLSESVGERVLASGQAGDVLLLRAQLVSQAGGVNHRLLGLVLGILGGDKHSVDLSLEGVDAGLQLALGSHITTVD